MSEARFTSLNDLITAKQLSLIRNAADSANIDPAAECEKLHGCSVSELSKTGAYELIEHLRAIVRKPSLAAGPKL